MNPYLISLLLLLIHCKVAEVNNFNKEIELHKNEQVIVGSGDRLRIEALEIKDSRCPPEVTCIWQGYAIVTMRVNSGATNTNVSLCMEACDAVGKSNVHIFTLNNVSYKISLLKIEKGYRDKLKAVINVSKL